MIVVAIAIYVFITLLIIFPILRKFKVATPVFRPLFFWQMKRSVFIMYALALLTTITTQLLPLRRTALALISKSF